MKRAVLPLLVVVGLLAGLPAAAQAQNPIHWAIARADNKPITAGAPFTVVVTATIDPGWHLYSLTQGPPPIATSLTVKDGTPFVPAGSIESPAPKTAFDQNFGIETEFYEDQASFNLPVKAKVGTKDGAYKLIVSAFYQTCNDRMCLPPKSEDVSLAINIGKVAAGATPAAGDVPATARRGPTEPGASTASAGITPTAASGGASGTARRAPTETGAVQPAANAPVPDLAAASATAGTLGAYVGLAALMGALSLLTPCVFPMVPITVSYFTNRGHKSRRESVTQALVYGLGIVFTFTLVGFTLAIGFGASGLNRFAADPWLNLGVTALFVAFALSLFGVFELALPAKLVTAASTADRGRGRFAGTLLMGFAFTLTSFTCTAPFLGTLLVLAAQGQWQWPLAGMLAFSSVFALPFVILALAPQLISSLPRSGNWLMAVKATMGLLELAAAMKFLSNVDLVWGWGIFTRNVVLVSWIVIAVVLVAYLAGLIKLGHAPRLRRPGVLRTVTAAAAVALGVWLGAGLAGHNLGELEAFLPPADLAGAKNGELPWIVNDYDTALAQAKREDRPVLIDFTGYTCTNCRWMEANMFPKPEVARELARFVRVRLYTDGQGALYQRFQAMQRDQFGTVALPYYAALNPDGKPVVAFGGLTRDPNEFVRFLRAGESTGRP